MLYYIDELAQSLIRGIELLEVNVEFRVPKEAFNIINRVVNTGTESTYLIEKELQTLVGIKPALIDCCINSCIAYTREYAHLTNCPICQEHRYKTDPSLSKEQPRKVFPYFSLIDRFRVQYRNSARSNELRYRARYVGQASYSTSIQVPPEYEYNDIFDGKRYKELVQNGMFRDPRDIALSVSTDGFQLYKQNTHECWPVILINHNLSPEVRVKKENILIALMIPGPKQPKNIDSFLVPLINELKELEDGVSCYDGYEKKSFILSAYTVFWSGDIPAITKLIGFTDHNSYHGCRFCTIRGIYHRDKRHIYYPPEGPDLPPLRSHQQSLEFLQKLEEAKKYPKNVQDEIIRETGINRRTILLELRTTSIPWSFPIDIMHLFFENVAPLMYAHWTGEFPFTGAVDINTDHVLPTFVWEQIGAAMNECQKSIPSDFGRPPRDIYKFNKGFKAEEWKSWVALYSLVFLKEYMPPRVLRGWLKFVSAVRLCLAWSLTSAKIQIVKDSLYLFYRHYIGEYAGGSMDHLPAHRITFHYLLHVADSIYHYGPPWAYWQFP
ncbi:uncharacterized protein VTP21DRAFT_1110, partial [Calcarisporiella thermophila]|uniref:uncharacterized protein n=1 Tax=Calcarisporiella thermophila TaxID=911321 RepID=UPI003744570B